jgi:hypothetical protein
MSGRRSRDKGARIERAIATVLKANGFAAAKISRAYRPGHDIVLSLNGRDGFRDMYRWLDQGDILIVKADRQEALVVLRMSLAAEIARAATPIRSESDIKGRAA